MLQGASVMLQWVRQQMYGLDEVQRHAPQNTSKFVTGGVQMVHTHYEQTAQSEHWTCANTRLPTLLGGTGGPGSGMQWLWKLLQPG
jgi:hypothetical protein